MIETPFVEPLCVLKHVDYCTVQGNGGAGKAGERDSGFDWGRDLSALDDPSTNWNAPTIVVRLADHYEQIRRRRFDAIRRQKRINVLAHATLRDDQPTCAN